MAPTPGQTRGVFQNAGEVIRAAVTVLVVVLSTIVCGLLVTLVGLFYPSRAVFAWAARGWAWTITTITGTRLVLEGLDPQVQGTPCMFLGNHQSALDIPILFTALKGRVRFLAKESLFRIPIFGWAMSLHGFVPITRTSARTTSRRLKRALARLKTSPISWVAFPEGTRSHDGGLLPFRRGTMKIAQESELPVVPFTMDGSVEVVRRGRFRVVPGVVTLRFHEAIPPGTARAVPPQELLERVREAVARGLSPQDGTGSRPVPSGRLRTENVGDVRGSNGA